MAKIYYDAHLLKYKGSYPYLQAFKLIDTKNRKQKCKIWDFHQGFPVSFNDFLVTWIPGSPLKPCPD